MADVASTTFNLLDLALSIIGTLGLFLLTEVWLEIKTNRREASAMRVEQSKHGEQLKALRSRVARLEDLEDDDDERLEA